jgi:L-alanine-DL-glutamate epimerase-like enolase superfamily enzyme
MTTPKPGKPVRGSQTGRPIMALLDLLGRRWTLRLLWELRMALWDARARACGVPLVTLLGGEPKPIPAYASGR